MVSTRYIFIMAFNYSHGHSIKNQKALIMKLFTAALALRSRGLVIAWSVFVVVVVVVV